MSFNFVELLLDRLLFPYKNNDNSINRKFTASQCLMESNSKMNHNILLEFHELLESNISLDTLAINRLSGVTSNLHYFDPSNYTLVSRIPKLFLPSLSTIFQDSFSGVPNITKKFESGSYLNNNTSFMFEKYPKSLFKARNLNGENLFSTEMPSNPKTCTATNSVCNESKLDSLQECCPSPKEVNSSQPAVDNSKVLNEELSNRKAKELQKRSKKRRRRQKKSGLNDVKEKTTSLKNLKNSVQKEEEKAIQLPPSSCTLSKSTSVNKDTLCDITATVRQTGSVHILLPEISSFFISVESASEDDVDWDTSSDSEWLSSCAEFELSGLFVSNLTASRTIPCLSDGFVSQLNVPCTHFNNAEAQKLNSRLLKVNRTWNESTKELEKKPKLTPKVTFAPDDRLVKSLPVDIYERKGEWETYALERCRFKKRINELEKILSPCFSKQHREKIFSNLQQLEL